jgi:hypothetical protein
MTSTAKSATSYSDKTFKNAPIAIGPLVSVLVQVCLAFYVAKLFAIEEERSFLTIIWLVAGLFAVHALLPLKFRLPVFIGGGIAVSFITLGLTRAIWILVIGASLIGMCHLPIRFCYRVVIVLVAGLLLTAIQARWIEATSKITDILPVLGAIFMFRLAIYLYDLRHEKGYISPWQRISYFFLLPNPLFPLFPVVDYKTFLKSYYSQPAQIVYQKGALWIVRGMVHLICYRLVYNYMSPAMSEITGLGEVAMWVVSSYLIYLRVSGQFHLIVGVLLLFGFNLPETHKHYLLASGFNDYWRRINIYWKDAMMKLVFYPVFTRVKGLGMVGGLVVSTAAVFVATWFLHDYQRFWLIGSFHIRVMDLIFWGIFAVLVIINSVYEAKRKPTQKRGATAWSWFAGIRLSLQVAAMLLLMCSLWSMWGCNTVGDWWEAVSQARHATATEVTWALLAVIGALGIGTVAQYFKHKGFFHWPEKPSVPQMAYTAVAQLLLMLAFGSWHFHQGFEGKLGEVAEAMRGADVRDQAQIDLERGYYEGLLSDDSSYAQMLRNQQTGFLPQGTIERDADFPENEEKWVRTGDLRVKTYPPLATGITVGKPWSTNQWGLRDQDYSKEKPEGVYRIAVVGASYTMGRGVADGKNFESEIERMVNDKLDTKVEVLNFATTSYSTLENVYVIDKVIGEFEPDALFLIAHGLAAKRCSRKLAKHAIDGVELSYPFLRDMKRKARLDKRLSEDENLRRIEPYSEKILAWCYQTMADGCRRDGIQPVWIFMPTTKRVNGAPLDIAEMRPFAEKAGFHTMAVSKAYGGLKLEEIRVHPDDQHPNEKSHKIFAGRLLETLKAEGPKFPLGIDLSGL